MHTSDSLAQPNSSMFERNIAHLSARRKEVSIRLAPSPVPIVGFLAGMDQEYLQVCKTEDQRIIFVARDLIVELEETGHTLTKYRRLKNLSEKEFVSIQGQVDPFAQRMFALVKSRSL